MVAGAFAVDLTAAVELEGNILSKKGDSFSMLTVKDLDPTQDKPNFTMSVNTDNAGAKLMNYASTDDHPCDLSQFQEWNIWFKPVDSIKVTLGHYEYKLNNPHFGWWHSLVFFPEYGAAFDFNAGAFSLNLGLGLTKVKGVGSFSWDDNTRDPYKTTKGAPWFDNSAEGFDKIGNFELILGYDLGEAGNIKAAVAKGAAVTPHGFSLDSAWRRNPLTFAVGYSNQPWGQTGYFVDVAAVMKRTAVDKFDLNNITSQMYFEFHKDALAIFLVNCVDYSLAQKKFKDGFEFKAQYPIESVTPYVQVLGYDIMDSKFEARLGVNGKVGGAVGYDIYLSADKGDEFGFSVPFKFTYDF